MLNIVPYLAANSYSGFSSLGNMSSVFTQFSESPTTALTVWTIVAVLTVIIIVSMWKIFIKAGREGWASIIPIYNTVILLRIINKPWWWIIIMFIPYVGAIIGIMMAYHLAKAFGKGGGFTLGLIFLPFIFYPILAFGDATYLPSQQPIPPTSPVPAQ